MNQTSRDPEERARIAEERLRIVEEQLRVAEGSSADAVDGGKMQRNG